MKSLKLLFERLDNQKGFTLVELMILMIIIGILSYVAVVKFSDTHTKIQYETMIRKIASDVRLAQQLALTQGTGTQVYIDQTNNRYYLKWEDGTYIQNPVGGGDFIIQLGSGDFKEVEITGTEFTGGRLDFNTDGSPFNAGMAFSGALNLVTLNNAKKILVIANTGLVKIEDL